MLTKEKRAEAFDAIKAAQPHWTDEQVRYAIEKMPTWSGYAYVSGSIQESAARSTYEVNLQVWLNRVLRTPNAEPFAEPDYATIRKELAKTPPATGGNVATRLAVAEPMKAGSKKQRVAVMLKQPNGVEVATIMTELGVTEPAAKALIGDVRRTGLKIEREGTRYWVA